MDEIRLLTDEEAEDWAMKHDQALAEKHLLEKRMTALEHLIGMIWREYRLQHNMETEYRREIDEQIVLLGLNLKPNQECRG